MSSSQKPVSFFIVGAPKAGTTALHKYLDEHPQVCMCEDKEPNYFSHQEISEQKLYYHKSNATTKEVYSALFRCNNHQISGETSVSYLFYPKVAQRIYDYNPEAKIIISIREPVKRAFSHFSMDYVLGLVKYRFDEIYYNGEGHPETGIYFQQYFLLGKYSPLIQRYLDVFNKSQILIILHDDLVQNSQTVLTTLSVFLGIEVLILKNGLKKQNVTAAGKNKFIRMLYSQYFIRKFISGIAPDTIKLKIRDLLFSKKNLPVMSESLIDKLTEYYMNDIQKLSEITGKDLSAWHNQKHLR